MQWRAKVPSGVNSGHEQIPEYYFISNEKKIIFYQSKKEKKSTLYDNVIQLTWNRHVRCDENAWLNKVTKKSCLFLSKIYSKLLRVLLTAHVSWPKYHSTLQSMTSSQQCFELCPSNLVHMLTLMSVQGSLNSLLIRNVWNCENTDKRWRWVQCKPHIHLLPFGICKELIIYLICLLPTSKTDVDKTIDVLWIFKIKSILRWVGFFQTWMMWGIMRKLAAF